MEKCAIFIDGSFLNRMLEKSFPGTRVDYGKLAGLVARDKEALRIYYYHCQPYVSSSPTEEETHRLNATNGFFNALTNIDKFCVRLGKLAYRGRDQQGKAIFTQKQVDVSLAVDMLILAGTGKISTSILIAGDSDFIPVVEAVKNLGVLVTLCHSKDHSSMTSKDLMQACDTRLLLSDELVAKAAL